MTKKRNKIEETTFNTLLMPLAERHLNSLMTLEALCFTIPWSREMFQDEISNDRAIYLVIEAQGRVIGYAGFWAVLDEGQITNIAVHPQFRRQGMGNRLVAALCDQAKARQLHKLFLEVRRSNHSALALYEKNGFERIGLRKGYYRDTGEDAIIMSKNLDIL